MSRVENLLSEINTALISGKTVRVATVYRYSDITQATVEKFRKNGYELFKVSGDNLYMRSGKRWDIISSNDTNFGVEIKAF